jgi:hypothetical protein
MKILMKDEIFEQGIVQRLAEAQGLAQSVLNEWNALSLGLVNGHVALYELINQPDIPFNEAANKLKLPAEGIDPKLAAAHVASVVIPYPEKLYKASEICKRNGYMVRELGLFSVDKNGKKVELVQRVAKSIIQSRTVVSENPQQEQFFDELEKLVNDLNRLNDKVNGQLLKNNCQTLGDVFLKPIREVPGYHTIGIEPNGLRQLLNTLK